jgi:BCD family chlorophyll transporter-like MFS transporter
MTGLGMHMTQTAGLALAADRATDETRPRVVALLYVMFLVGMGVSAVVIGWLLRQFTPLELIQVIQGCAVLTVVLNVTALWKQERVRPMTKAQREAPSRASRTPGPTIPAAEARGGFWSSCSSAPWPSTCRTFCWNLMAAKSSGFRCLPQRF